ncbi:TRAP transporter large permease [Paracoccus sediminicola]|uniref:TRAP transporter large permease n=1 Tax=Paracoccus sediminicola TaxID=3017783 RepID=UPI0022F052CC|nr:TRAP transporter large permease subunit [Paracoccus sediminicola]WBU56631.1 TRAP transporter large permease subunit [Paracoccus sediminicola]
MLDLWMIAALIVGIVLGYPVAFTISGIAVLFAGIGWLTGGFDAGLFGAIGQRFFGVMTNRTLIAIPLFVMMGVILQRSGIAERLLETMARMFGHRRGGLGISVVLVGALLAASTGIVGATVIAMGMIALPTMIRNGYDVPLACGTVCTAGTLGQIIPPSTLLIILSDVMSSAYQQAQYAQGKFSIQTISVGQTFAAAMLPGLAIVGIYLLYLVIRAWLRPQDMTPVMDETGRPSAAEIMAAVVPPIALIVAVLGAILGGIATPTEAGAVGAAGALLLAARHAGMPGWQFWAGFLALLALAIAAGVAPVRMQRNDLTETQQLLGMVYAVLALVSMLVLALGAWRIRLGGMLSAVVTETATVSAMIFATILMAGMFSLVFIGLGGEERLADLLESMPGGPTGALLFTMGLIFLLGFFLDFVEISVILLPLVVPMLITMGHDPIWLAVLIAINLQTSFLTPPFGFSLFYLRGAAPPEVSTGQIYRGVVPYLALQAAAVAVVWLLPVIATWLPGWLYG